MFLPVLKQQLCCIWSRRVKLQLLRGRWPVAVSDAALPHLLRMNDLDQMCWKQTGALHLEFDTHDLLQSSTITKKMVWTFSCYLIKFTLIVYDDFQIEFWLKADPFFFWILKQMQQLHWTLTGTGVHIKLHNWPEDILIHLERPAQADTRPHLPLRCSTWDPETLFF